MTDNNFFTPFRPIFVIFGQIGANLSYTNYLKQAVAELGQTQVKLEVVNDVVVKVRS